jgi:hypothetical protein
MCTWPAHEVVDEDRRRELVQGNITEAAKVPFSLQLGWDVLEDQFERACKRLLDPAHRSLPAATLNFRPFGFRERPPQPLFEACAPVGVLVVKAFLQLADGDCQVRASVRGVLVRR